MATRRRAASIRPRQLHPSASGTALTRRPLHDAAARQYESAILQAAPDGVSIYECVGFSAFGDITEFKPRPGFGVAD
jgi:LAS superfamily LD-carboxypeptidase LdcB